LNNLFKNRKSRIKPILTLTSTAESVALEFWDYPFAIRPVSILNVICDQSVWVSFQALALSLITESC